MKRHVLNKTVLSNTGEYKSKIDKEPNQEIFMDIQNTNNKLITNLFMIFVLFSSTNFATLKAVLIQFDESEYSVIPMSQFEVRLLIKSDDCTNNIGFVTSLFSFGLQLSYKENRAEITSFEAITLPEEINNDGLGNPARKSFGPGFAGAAGALAPPLSEGYSSSLLVTFLLTNLAESGTYPLNLDFFFKDPDLANFVDIDLNVLDNEIEFGSAIVRVKSKDQETIIGEAGNIQIDQADPQTWHKVDLLHTYKQPVVIMEPISFNEQEPAHIRIKNVGPDGFEFRIEEWDYLDGVHLSEAVSYLVVESGVHALDNGSVLEAGLGMLGGEFSTIPFEHNYVAPPVLLSATQSIVDDTAVVVHIDQVGLKGFRARLSEQESFEIENGNTPHEDEVVGYVAIEENIGKVGAQIYESRRTEKEFSNLFNTIEFMQTFAEPIAFLANKNTQFGSDPSSLRRQNLTLESVEVFVEEEDSKSTGISHLEEVIGFFAISPVGLIKVGGEGVDRADLAIEKGSNVDLVEAGRPFTYTITIENRGPAKSEDVTIIDLLPQGVDVLLANEYEQAMDGSLLFEMGDLDVSQRVELKVAAEVQDGVQGVLTNSVSVSSSTFDPDLSNNTSTVLNQVSTLQPGSIIGEVGKVSIKQSRRDIWHTVEFISSYLDPIVVMNPLSFNGVDSAHTRLRNVSHKSFEFKIEEWEYLDGSHVQESVSYIVLEKGVHRLGDGSILEAGQRLLDGAFSTLAFEHSYTIPPVVLCSVQTLMDSTAVVIHVEEVHPNGFKARLSEQEAFEVSNGNTPHELETIGYIAIDRGRGKLGAQTYEAGLTPLIVGDQFTNIRFTQSFKKIPAFVANRNTEIGSDPSNLRYQNLTEQGVELVVQEETSNDKEVDHLKEAVGYFAIEPTGLIQIE